MADTMTTYKFTLDDGTEKIITEINFHEAKRSVGELYDVVRVKKAEVLARGIPVEFPGEEVYDDPTLRTL